MLDSERLEGEHLSQREGSTMAKQASKRKRVNTSLPVLGAAGVSLAVAGGASATAPTANVQDTGSRTVITLSEEEIADVNLATFYVFDKEDARIPQAGVQLAWRGCRGCRACRACRAFVGVL